VISSPDKLKVVLQYSLVVTTPGNVENIIKRTDIDNNSNVIGILVLVENDFLRNYVQLTKLKKVVGLFDNFEDIYSYVIMTVLLI
jgi:hypothetical protein